MTHPFLSRPGAQAIDLHGPRIGLAAALCLTAALAAPPATALADTAWEVAGGYVQNIHGKSTGVLLLEVPVCSQTVEESSSRWCPEPWLVGIGRRSDSDEPSLRREELIGGVSVRWAHPNWWASFGAGLTDRITVALSSRYQFRSVVGVNVGPALVSSRTAALAHLPLTDGPTPFGTLALAWEHGRELDPADREWLGAVATVVAAALVGAGATRSDPPAAG